ncbi:MAG: putative ABC transporter permease [Treponemataceae bacterium]
MSGTPHEQILNWFLYFSAASGLGWILESTFRSIQEHRLVNSGFLSGPFVPIYGFGALFVALLARLLAHTHGVLFWAILAISPTIVEYTASYLLEKLFGLRLWDYQDQPFNLKGRVCLAFSLCWVVLTAFAVFYIEPFLLGKITAIGIHERYFLSGALSMYFAMDTVGSSRAIINFKAFVVDLKALAARGGAFFPSLEIDAGRLPREIKRLVKPLKAFPQLSGELKPMLHAIPDWITARLESIIGGRHFHK